MNLKRGLLRIWCVLSLLWIGGCAAYVYANSSRWLEPNNYGMYGAQGKILSIPPIAVIGKDRDKEYIKHQFGYQNNIYVHNSVPADTVAGRLGYFRENYVADNVEGLFNHIKKFVALVVLPILATLFLLFAVLWIKSGFKT